MLSTDLPNNFLIPFNFLVLFKLVLMIKVWRNQYQVLANSFSILTKLILILFDPNIRSIIQDYKYAIIFTSKGFQCFNKVLHLQSWITTYSSKAALIVYLTPCPVLVMLTLISILIISANKSLVAKCMIKIFQISFA